MEGDKKVVTWQVTKAEEIPDEEHYAIIEFGSHNCSDGWGGTRQQTDLVYHVFMNREDWENDVSYRTRFRPSYGSPKPFRAIHVRPAKITVSVAVGVKNASTGTEGSS